LPYVRRARGAEGGWATSSRSCCCMAAGCAINRV
jgi:hypothetical protein